MDTPTATVDPCSDSAPELDVVSARKDRAAGVLSARWATGVFGVYLAASLLLWRSYLPHLASRTITRGVLDPGIYIWWLNWVPYAILHGLDPFRSSYLNAPSGVNAMWNTSIPAIGVAFAPITLVFGPIASFNIAAILGPALSSWTAWWWLRRHASDLAAAFGGLLFGFSPFVSAESQAGHLSLTVLALLPLLLMLLEDVLWRSPTPQRRAVLLGVVIAAQLLVGPEALLIVAIGCLLGVPLLALLYRSAVRRRAAVVARAGAIAVGIAVVLCAWPLYEQFGGHRAIDEPVHPLGTYGGTLAMLVGAPRYLALHSGRGPRGHLAPAENGLYVGWPLLVLLVLTAVVLFRRPGVVIATAVALTAAAFQMYGTRWHFGGFSVPAPLAVLQDHVAITRDILPGRFAVLMWLAIAWLVAVGLDTAMRHVARRLRWLPVLVAAVSLVPLLPGPAPPATALRPTPRFFTTSLKNAIPAGSTVMIAPMATVTQSVAELWQIKSGMRFRQLGGYMLHPTDGGPSFCPTVQTLTSLFGLDWEGRAFAGTPTATQLEQAREELTNAGAQFFIVGYSTHAEAAQLTLAEQLLDRKADRRVGDVYIWNLTTRTPVTAQAPARPSPTLSRVCT